jgi:hypothetical protein
VNVANQQGERPAMFHGMAMYVIDVPRKINLIPGLMFTIPLPDAALTLGLTAGSNMLALYQPRDPVLDERAP